MSTRLRSARRARIAIRLAITVSVVALTQSAFAQPPDTTQESGPLELPSLNVADTGETAAGYPSATAQAPEQVIIQGNLIRTTTAVGLDLTLRETPQSVTVVTGEQVRDFALTNVNEVLSRVPGVNVEQVETDRTYYNSRGFDITNFQVDGIGLPLIWGIQFGDLDTAIFDRVEVVRGANGMLTGTGNPSATVNYIRKRPTETFRAFAAARYGSWNDKRLEADVSGPLNGSGSVKGRLVYANTDRESYLDYNAVNRNVFYGILSWDITSRLNATAGYSWQDNRSKGVLWGALPLTYSDGDFIDYPVSASTSADWTFWNVRDQSAFGELSYRFDNDWQVKAVGTYKQFDELAKLLYAFGNPEKADGLGVFGMTGIYPSEYKQYLLDLYASGPFSLFGRAQALIVGASTSYAHGLEHENFYEDFPAYPPIGNWGTEQVAEPVYPGAYLATDQSDHMHRFYAAAHLDLADRLNGVVGFNAVKVKSSGYSYGEDTPRDEGAVSPYIGAVFDVTEQLSLYASYTDIFNPQSQVDINHQTLPAAHGVSYEGGIKSEWFGKRLYATASVFKSEQDGLAEYAGAFDNGRSYYAGVDTFVTGYEFEIAGRITDNWTVAGGWTQLWISGADGEGVRTYLPRQTFKLETTYTVPSLNDLRLGAALRWQDEISMVDLVEIPQEAYAVLDLMAGIRLTDRVRATINVRNVTDKKYLASLMWNQAFYAAPRSVFFTLDYSF